MAETDWWHTDARQSMARAKRNLILFNNLHNCSQATDERNCGKCSRVRQIMPSASNAS